MADSQELTKQLLDQKFATYEEALKHWKAVYLLYFTELKRPVSRSSSPFSTKEGFLQVEKEERQKLEYVLEKIRSKATQFSLSASGTAGVEDVAPFGLMLLENLVSLLAVFQSTANFCGESKISHLQQDIIRLFERVDTLIQRSYNLHIQNIKKNGKGVDEKALPPLTGCVWEVCDEIKKGPVRDSSFACCAAKGHFRVMKDALEELNESIKEAKKQKNKKVEEEFECVVTLPILQSSHLLVRTTCSLCLNIEKLFLATDPLLRSEEPLKTVKLCDDIVSRLKILSERVDDVVAAAYEGEGEMQQHSLVLKALTVELLGMVEAEKVLFKGDEWEKFVKVADLSRNMLK